MKRSACLWAFALILIAGAPVTAGAATDGHKPAAPVSAATSTPPAPAPGDSSGQHKDLAAPASTSRDAGADVGKASEASATALMKLFALAAVLESALALLFNWRPFVAMFDGRGVKSVISLLASWVLVYSFRIDIVQDLMREYGATATTPFSELITAMVVAGGSAGVNRLLRTFGFREVVSVDDITPKPPPTVGWLAVIFAKQTKSQGAVEVELNEGGAGFRTAGTIAAPSRMTLLMSYFVRDPGRLPMSGGMSVTPGAALQVRLTGVDASDAAVTSAVWTSNGLTPGAIVNVSLSL